LWQIALRGKEPEAMTVRMKAALRRSLAGLVLGGVIAFASIPAATAQWLRPWPAASPGDIEQRLEAQGYLLIGPLYRRPMVYLADVSAGPAGRQRLVIDAWSGVILQRFVVSPRRWGPVFASREGGFAEPMPPGAAGPQPGGGFSNMPPGAAEAPPGGGFSTMPDDSPAPRSAYGGPPHVHIPAAISPFGSPDAPSTTKLKPKSNATSHNKVPGTTTVTPAAAPLPPAPPREATTPDAAPAGAPQAPSEQGPVKPPKTEPAPTEVQSAPPAPPDEAEQASVAPPAELKPEAPKSEPQPEAQNQPAATPQPAQARSVKLAAPARDSAAGSSEKSKVSIVPAAAFE
jgi:hypothetical protein